MNKEKQKLIPKLRFPEFKDDDEWKIEPFNDVYDFKITNSFSRDKLNYEKGEVKNIHYGDIHTKFSSHFDITKEYVPYINSDISIERIDKDNYCKEGDLVIADASEDIDDIGKSIEIVNLNNEKLLAGLHTFLARPLNCKIKSGFGGHLFKSNGILNQIKKEAQGAKVLGISKGRLANLNIYHPENPKEQQKIANCLSSLDNLITAESEKLDHLKDHKKGLLQQLFPAKGETKPQFRFPEFENDGDWEINPLKKVFSIFQGYSFFSKDSVEKGTRWLKIADVSIQNMKHNNPSFLPDDYTNIYDKFLIKKGDYVLALTRPILNGELKISAVDDLLHNSLLNQRVGRLVSNENLTLVYYLLQTNYLIEEIEKSIAGSEPPNLSMKQIENIKIYFPKDANEQQKIANCLSSADDLIKSQTTKIETLKAHKKGLMQQLFPNVNSL